MNIYTCYSVFDNEELLENSIKNIRNYVSEICVLYQKVSNHGNLCDPNLEDLLHNLKKNNLIDHLQLYEPNLNYSAEVNELAKNNLAYNLSKKSNCDYAMIMACDEFYFEDEFKKLLDFLDRDQVDLVTSYMYTYYKTTNYRFKEIENYVVPILHKIYKDRNYMLNYPSHILIDPCRRMPYSSYLSLDKSTPLMHHLSHVRKDYRKKLLNSTARLNWHDKIEKCVEYYNNWMPGDDAYVYGKFEKLEFTDRFKKEITF